MGACTHGMPTPASCIECMEDGNLPVPPRQRPEILARSTARFDGTVCRWCDRPIRVDDSIALLGLDGHEAWGHELCVESEVR